jgi:DNA-binding transcriptional LysR family regulator
MFTETLRVFCDVVETKSFTTTARRHRVTQSAVTQMFRGLEKQFKTRFAVRKPKGFRLTPEGEKFYAVCRRVLQIEAKLFRRIQETRDAGDRIIQLAACHTVGLHQLPDILAGSGALTPLLMSATIITSSARCMKGCWTTCRTSASFAIPGRSAG